MATLVADAEVLKLYMYDMRMLLKYITVLFEPWILRRTLGSGTRRGGVFTPQRKCKARPESVARDKGILYKYYIRARQLTAHSENNI